MQPASVRACALASPQLFVGATYSGAEVVDFKDVGMREVMLHELLNRLLNTPKCRVPMPYALYPMQYLIFNTYAIPMPKVSGTCAR